VQNLLPVKEENSAVEADMPSSSEQKSQPSCSASVASVDSVPAASERRRRKHSGDDSTRDSSPGSDRGSRSGPAITERVLRDRMVPSGDHGEERGVRDSSPVSDRGSRGSGANTDRSLRDRAALVGDRGTAKERVRVKRGDVNGTASSSASTCSEDSELRINDFLG